jgi:hypothetical protein
VRLHQQVLEPRLRFIGLCSLLFQVAIAPGDKLLYYMTYQEEWLHA